MVMYVFYVLSFSIYFIFFFLMIRRPPRSTLFPTRRSSDLGCGRTISGRRPRSSAARRARSSSGSTDRKSTRLNSSHLGISYAVFCLKKKKKKKKYIYNMHQLKEKKKISNL